MTLLRVLAAVLVGATVSATTLVTGHVYDASGAALPGATVYVRGTRSVAVTDAEGFFSLESELEGPGVVVVTLAGFRAAEAPIEIVDTAPPPSLRVVLDLASYSEAVSVRARPESSSLPHRFRVETLDVYRTAGTNADPLLAAQMLPGVAKADEGAGLFVRGGDVLETRTFLDRALISHPYRYESVNGGVFGVVPPYLITGLSLSAGGFPARYGDTLSGVLELHGLDRPRVSSTLVTMGLAAASAMVSLPIGERAGVRVSGNQSFTRLMFAVNRPEQRFARYPSGTDLNVGGYVETESYGRFHVFAFRAAERVGVEVEEEAFRGELSNDSDNGLIGLRWSHRISPRWLAELTASRSSYRQRVDVGALELESGERAIRTRLDLSGVSRGWTLRLGGEHERRTDVLAGSAPSRGGDLAGVSGARDWSLDAPFNRAGGYIELERVWGRLGVNAGLRSDRYQPFARWTVDPRLSIRFRLSGRHHLRAAIGRYHQAPSSAYLDDQWGNPGLGVMRARHVVLGYENGAADDSFHFRVEVYDKRYSGLPVEDLEKGFVDAGTGFARGVDIFARARGGEAWELWGSYGYLTTRRRHTRLADVGRFAVPAHPVRPDFEIPHTLQLAARRALPWNVGVSASFRLSSGKPFTPIVGAAPVMPSGVLAPVYGALNGDRLPLYRRLDVAVNQLRSWRDRTAVVLFAGVTNVLNRRNVFGYAYSPDFSSRRPRSSSFGRSLYFGVSFQR